LKVEVEFLDPFLNHIHNITLDTRYLSFSDFIPNLCGELQKSFCSYRPSCENGKINIPILCCWISSYVREKLQALIKEGLQFFVSFDSSFKQVYLNNFADLNKLKNSPDGRNRNGHNQIQI
jgi:hypothetical protein